jgi:membrane protein
VFRILRDAGQAWSDDNGAYLGAGLAYYALFSVAPLLVLALDIAAIAYGEAAAKNQIVGYLEEFINPAAAVAIQNMVLQDRNLGVNWWSSLLAAAVLLITAANLFIQVKIALMMIWKLPPLPDGLIRRTVKNYLAALAMVVVALVYGLIFMLGTTFLGVVVDYWGELLPGGPLVWRYSNLGFFLFLSTVLLIFCFRFLSDGRIGYRFLWKGALLTTVLLMFGKIVFGWYLYFMAPQLTSVYGAASSLIVFLIWVYYSAQILFLGAELVKIEMAEKTKESTQMAKSG